MIDYPSGWYPTNYKQTMSVIKTPLQGGLLIAFLVLLFTIPIFASTSMVTILNHMAITLMAVLGLQIVTGYCGQIHLGQAAFVGIGAYAAVLLGSNLGVPFLPSVILAGLITGVAGLLVGLPSLRIKGFYLALATIAAQMLFTWFGNYLSITGGPAGIDAPDASVGPFTFTNPREWYFLIMIIVIILTVLAKNIVRSKSGRAFIAIKNDDLAAASCGINVFQYKLLAFFICSVFAGIAGGLWAYYIGRINPEHFLFMDSIWYLGMLIVGGMGSIAGTILGVVFITGIDELISSALNGLSGFFTLPVTVFSSATLIIFAVVIILFLVLEPRGLFHSWEKFKAYYRLWPFAD